MSHPPTAECDIEGCGKPVEPGRNLCRGHRARKQRRQPVDAPLRSWRDEKRALFEAALALAFVEGDEAEALRVIRRFWAAHARAAVVFRNKVPTEPQSGSHDREHRQARPRSPR